jgi:catechol 2,3-dioxygenase-like lactoylglutathione lyase family enzyme
MEAPQLKVTGINHVVLHVGEIERSVRFYVDVLGFENSGSTTPRQKMSFLRCGTQGLDLFEIAGDPHGGEEMNHMALSVDADDLDEVEIALERAGVERSERTPRNSIFIHDPDGHQIEMLPRSSAQRARESQGLKPSA